MQKKQLILPNKSVWVGSGLVTSTTVTAVAKNRAAAGLFGRCLGKFQTYCLTYDSDTTSIPYGFRLGVQIMMHAGGPGQPEPTSTPTGSVTSRASSRLQADVTVRVPESESRAEGLTADSAWTARAGP